MPTRTTSFLAGLIAAGTIAAIAIADAKDTLSGPVWSIADGDTIYFGEREHHRTPIRLWGIDAPEWDQMCGQIRCGQIAARTLMRMLEQDRKVTCTIKAEDRYKRIVAVCRNSGGDLGARMVALGWAIDYTKYSKGAYRDQQEAARAEKLGLWNLDFIEPAAWRRQKGQ